MRRIGNLAVGMDSDGVPVHIVCIRGGERIAKVRGRVWTRTSRTTPLVATHRSLQSYVTLLIASLVGAALVAVLVTFSVVELYDVRSSLTQDARFIAGTILAAGDRPSPFADSNTLAHALGQTQVHPSLRALCFYDTNGALMAQHVKAGGLPCDAPRRDASIADRFLHVEEPLLWRGARVGRLELFADAPRVWHAFANLIVSVALAALATFITILAVGARLARRATDPLRTLTAMATGQLSGGTPVPAEGAGPGEARALTHTFNRLIDDLLVARREAEDELRQRRSTQHALNDMQVRLARIVDAVPHPLFAVRADRGLLFVNAAVAEAYGKSREELIAASGNEPRPPDDPLLYTSVAAPSTHEIWFVHARSGIRRLRVSRLTFDDDPDSADTTAGSQLVIALDVTEERRLRQQLEFVHRSEVPGAYTGGIAHNFNNLLAPIMAYTTLLLAKRLPKDTNDQIEAVYSAAMKARAFVQHVLSFSHDQSHTAHRRWIDPAVVLNDAAGMIRASIPKTIDLRMTTAAGLPEILADPDELLQVIVELCTRTSQSMPGARGSIDVSLDRVSDKLCFTLTGDGAGINADVMARIFDPHRPPNESGRDVEPDLRVVQGIVAAHGGSIDAQITEGSGCTFCVYLPIGSRVAMPRVEMPNDAKRVLLVDDEAAVLRATTDVLESFGYQVQAYSSARAALDAFRSAADPFDIVVTDNLMPGMTGVELARVLRGISAAIPVLLMTGYPDEREVDPAVDRRIMKPASAQELADAIRQVIARVAA